MATVCLIPADPQQDATHWQNSYSVLQRSFRQHAAAGRHSLVDDLQAADLILVCGPIDNPGLSLDLLMNPVIRANKAKCVRLCTEDYALPLLRGFYPSLPLRHYDERYFRGGLYPHASEGPLCEALPLDGDFPYLFSFMGAYGNHPIRSAIGRLAYPRCLLRDTAHHPGCEPGQLLQVYRDFRDSYIEGMRQSKFVLCPRGMCASSMRVFEAMQARRVPVVISDDWVRPPTIPWEQFCVFVPEKDVLHIPRILEGVESTFADKADMARRCWERYLAPANLADTVTDWALDLLHSTPACAGGVLGVPFSRYAWRFLEWRFWRRGVIPEVRRRLRGAMGRRAAGPNHPSAEPSA